MQYASGSPGRIFYIRFDHEEDLLTGIQTFITDHQIGAGIIHIIGAISAGSLVTGARDTTLPPDMIWKKLDESHDIIGTGMIRTGSQGPKVHLHASAGRGDIMLTGCFREETRVYILIEAVIIEFTGFTIGEIQNEQTGLHLPSPDNANEP